MGWRCSSHFDLGDHRESLQGFALLCEGQGNKWSYLITSVLFVLYLEMSVQNLSPVHSRILSLQASRFLHGLENPSVQKFGFQDLENPWILNHLRKPTKIFCHLFQQKSKQDSIAPFLCFKNLSSQHDLNIDFTHWLRVALSVLLAWPHWALKREHMGSHLLRVHMIDSVSPFTELFTTEAIKEKLLQLLGVALVCKQNSRKVVLIFYLIALFELLQHQRQVRLHTRRFWRRK